MNRRLLLCSQILLLIVSVECGRHAYCQALNMDGQSGIFFQPTANVVPADSGKFNGPTLSYHMVDAGPVAADCINVGLEEGYGNRLEFGFTRSSHTDGGNPGLALDYRF